MKYNEYLKERTKEPSLFSIPILGWCISILWFGLMAPLGFILEKKRGNL